MAMLQPIRCDHCGKVEYGFNGPVVPVDPNKPPQQDPPGTGYYTVSGPSFGLGFPPVSTACSKEHVIAIINGEPPIAPTSEDPEMRGWRQKPPEKRGRN